MAYAIIGDEKSPQDIIADKTEQILCKLRDKNASLFTVGELFWVQYWTSKVRWSTSIEYEEKLFKEFDDFLKEIEEREKTT